MRYVFGLIALSLSFGVQAKPVHLRQDHTVKSEFLKLSDFFVGVSKEKDEEILEAPEPGTSKHYPYLWVKQLAHNFGISWKPFNHKGLVISRADTLKFSKEQAREVVRNFIQQNHSQKLAQGDVDVCLDDPYSAQDLSNTATLQKLTWKNDDVFTAVLSDGQKMSTVQGILSRVMCVPVLKHKLAAGTEIAKSDIEYVAMPSKQVSKTTILHADKIIGRSVARGSITSGEALKNSDLVDPIVIKRGDTVVMKVQSHNITVTLKGAAQGNASAGQPIKVMNLQSKKIIEGVVQDGQTVLVMASGG